MALNLGDIKSAYMVWINGILVKEYGIVNKSIEAVKQYVLKDYRIPVFVLNRIENEIVVQVLSYHTKPGGFYYNIKLGKKDDILESRFRKIIITMIIAGCIFFMSIYNLFLFWFRKKDRSPLYFFFFSFPWTLNIINLNWPFLGDAGFNEKSIYFFDYITMAVNLPLVMMLLRQIFPDDCSRIVIRLTQLLGSILILSVFFTDYNTSKQLMDIYFLISALGALYGVYVLIKTIYYKREDAILLFIGFFAMILFAINDMLHELGILYTQLAFHFGLLIFCFSMSVLISRRFSRAFSSVEILSEELEEKNIALMKIDKLKDEFLANTSHELRTPLHGIIGISESILNKTKAGLPEDINEDISLIASSGHRLSNLVNDILDFSRIKYNELELNLKPVDISSITDLVIKLSYIMMGDKSLEIINSIPADLPFALADEDRIKQVMHNLIGNAIKFTNKGTINISASVFQKDNHADDGSGIETDSIIEITIADTGIGIPQTELGSIFDSFQQVDGTDSRIHGGTGLGLAITKQLVELHNGKLSVVSEVNKGSTFRFTLPVSKSPAIGLLDTEKSKKDEESSIELKNHEEPYPEPLSFEFDHHPVILIVDDDPTNIKILQNYLGQDNCTLLTAMNGLQAMDIIKENGAVDLVLLDIMMPMISGYEVCRRIREKYTHEELPIIMLTAKTQISDINAGYEAGANDYIVKPFQIRELHTRMDTMLKLKNIHRPEPTGISLSDRGNDYHFEFNEIIYISIQSKKTVIHTLERDVEIAVMIKDFIESLPGGLFMRIHRQHIVNISHILKVSHVQSGRYKVILKDENDTDLPVGKAYVKNLKEKI